MKKISYIILAVVFAICITGCGDNREKEKEKEYTDKVTKEIVEKGYTVDELSALKNGQWVDKVYDGAVLERFGMVMVYHYDVTEIRKHYVGNTSTESTKPLEEYQAGLKNTETAALVGYSVIEAAYNADFTERYTAFFSNYSETCPIYLSMEEIKSILTVEEYGSKWYKEVFYSKTESGKSLIFPLATN